MGKRLTGETGETSDSLDLRSGTWCSERSQKGPSTPPEFQGSPFGQTTGMERDRDDQKQTKEHANRGGGEGKYVVSCGLFQIDCRSIY